MIVLRSKVTEERIVQYDIRQAFFHQVDLGLEAFSIYWKF